jgi:TonB family protein
MTSESTLLLEEPAPGTWRNGAVGLLLGVGFTLMLFLGLAHIEHATTDEPAQVFSDLQSAAMTLEPPPPPPPTPGPAVSDAPATPIIGGLGVQAGDVGAAVKVTVSPRDVSQLLPARAITPSMKALTQARYSELRPKMDLAGDIQRIYQVGDVDERPQILIEAKPYIPPVVRMGAKELQVTLLFVVDSTGAVASVRILRSSNNKFFDEIVAECVHHQWIFSPAVKRGRKVKCLVQRAIIVRWSTSPFGD